MDLSDLFITFFNRSVSAGWMILAVLCLRLLFRRAPRGLLCLLWALVAVRLVCPWSLESALSLIPSTETLPHDILLARNPTVQTGIPALNSAINPTLSEALAPEPTASVNPMQVYVYLAALAWCVGMAAMALYGVCSYVRVYLRVRESVRSEGNVYLCDRIETPFIFGLFRPRIYLPSTLSETDTQYVLAHERAHLARRDHWWKPVGFMLLSVYWFHPLLWVAYILLCRDMELACDERVLRMLGTEARKPYSEALIRCSEAHPSIGACPLAFGEVGVRKRVREILHYKKPALWIVAAAVIVCIATAVCFLTDPVIGEKKDGSADPLSFAAEDSYLFSPVELVYDCGKFSFVMTAEAAPKVRLYADQTLHELTATDDPTVKTITERGKMTEVKLTAAEFDAAFDSYGKEIAATLRKNNRRAFSIRFIEEPNSIRYWYLLLEQTDGSSYFVIGYFDQGDAEVDLVRWVFRTNLTVEKSIRDIDTTYPYATYVYTGSVDPIDPSISLFSDGTFSFGYSAFSSYLPFGTYTLDADTLTLKTGDGLYTYVFTVLEDGFAFDATRSSTIPSYRYSGDSPVAECPVPNGAVFKRKDLTDAYISH